MTVNVKRVFVEKKPGFDVEAQAMLADLKENLAIKGLNGLRLLNRYDFTGVNEEYYQECVDRVFSEPPVDYVYNQSITFSDEEHVFAVEYLPGQYDQRADSAEQCIQIITGGQRPHVVAARVICLKGSILSDDLEKVKAYCINPVDSRQAAMDIPAAIIRQAAVPANVIRLQGFINKNTDDLKKLHNSLGLAMTLEDLLYCQDYFKNEEKRDPSITEIRVLDTYWSDHCRHTTFQTPLESVEITDGEFAPVMQSILREFGDSFAKNCPGKAKFTLMDIAVHAAKTMRAAGLLPQLDISDEINACSIKIDVTVDGKPEKWLLMFKNETHNHPTEIEPFGGAATCLGGAIRDPLSGRAYVYQAMRVTGSADPRALISDTMSGKLPQRKITTGAAAGYSSYGNQIGVATGQVAEIYHPGYVAKRMEVGAVIAAVRAENVIRVEPQPGDVVILVGGRTGRDGCGGATGSSKSHDESSLESAGAEVQKGNAVTERKLQRLFRNGEVSRMIKRCNDFGAGGVSVAIGEIAEGVVVNLDTVPKKYDGLDGTELAISESQERMAVAVAKEDAASFIKHANEENLEATIVADVVDEKRMVMFWRGDKIVDVSRAFLESAGIARKMQAVMTSPDAHDLYFTKLPSVVADALPDIAAAWMANIEDLNVCGERGLGERFDSSIGAGTVLSPYGGKYQATAQEGMVAKISLITGETDTASAMAYGFDPFLSEWSPMHGAAYAVLESVAKIICVGGHLKDIYLSLQEYFERLGEDTLRWGKPLAALLGAWHAQKELGIAAIGGKDSMSGSFNDINVPPTLISFAVAPVSAAGTVSAEFKKHGSKVVLLHVARNKDMMPDFEQAKINFAAFARAHKQGMVLSAATVRAGGLAASVSRMAFGNRIGFSFAHDFSPEELFIPAYGSIVVELKADCDAAELFEGAQWRALGKTIEDYSIIIGRETIDLGDVFRHWDKTLTTVFPNSCQQAGIMDKQELWKSGKTPAFAVKRGIVKPRVVIPVFPGTNCEIDTRRAFEKAGASVEEVLVCNLTPEMVKQSVARMVEALQQAQILMFPGGFSAGDEPDGSGKFIAAFFANTEVTDAVMNLLKNRDGLALGICNGFQAMLKLGLLPYGEIKKMSEMSPTLSFNTIGRHVARVVRTRISSDLSPWTRFVKPGDIHTIPVSHGEGRFVCSQEELLRLGGNGQIVARYVDHVGNPTFEYPANPNGSFGAVEAICSPDGRILGKMGHSERIGSNILKNIQGVTDQKLFEAGVIYFK